MEEMKPANKQLNPRYKTEYSMWLFDYERMNEILIACDNLSVSVMTNETRYLPKFYASCRAFYQMIRPVMGDTKTGEFDAAFDKIYNALGLSKGYSDTMYQNSEGSLDIKIPETVCEDMRKIYQNLLDMKQTIGLGFPVTKNMSTDEKLKKVFK